MDLKVFNFSCSQSYEAVCALEAVVKDQGNKKDWEALVWSCLALWNIVIVGFKLAHFLDFLFKF